MSAITENATSTGRRSLAATTWLLPVVLFLSTFAVYAATAERHAINTDAYAASAGAWRIATAGTPWFDGMDVAQLHGTHGDAADGRWLTPAPNGHVTAQRMAGPILAGVPFYWLLAEGSSPSDFSLFPGGLAAAALTAAVVLLLFLTVRRWLSERTAATAALVFAFTSPTWSVSANGLWTHPVTQLGIAGAAWASSRSRWWLAGAFLGIGMLGRPHVAVIAAILGLGVGVSRRRVVPVLAVGLPSAAALGFLELWNHAVFGVWSIGGAYGDGRIAQAAEGLSGDSQLVNYLGFFVSPDRGFLVWSPLVMILLPGLVRSWRGLPDWSRWLVVGGLAYTFFQLRLNHFAGGVGFHGYRHGLELLTCLAPALALSWPATGRPARLLAPVVVAAQGGAFLLGAVLEGFFVPLDRVWVDNSLWLELRDQPAVVGTWLGLCLLVGIVISVRVNRSSDGAAQAREIALGE